MPFFSTRYFAFRDLLSFQAPFSFSPKEIAYEHRYSLISRKLAIYSNAMSLSLELLAALPSALGLISRQISLD